MTACTLLGHHEDGLWCPAAGGRKAFLSGSGLESVRRVFLPASAALSTVPGAGPLWAVSPRCLLLTLHEGGPRAPHLGGGSFLGCPGVAHRGGFFSSLGTEHCPLSGLLWALLAQFLPAALAPPRHHSCPGSRWLFPWRVCSGTELCLFLGSISPGVLACAKGFQACCPIGSCHSPALPARDTSPGQARERCLGIAGQEAQGRNFLKAESMTVMSSRGVDF